MQPDSEFINSVFSKKIPPNIEYFLFFGHKGNRNPLRPNNDNVVTLESQLDQRAQREAKMIYGFNEDHVSILASERVLSQYNTILADTYARTRDADKARGNRLRLDFTFDYPPELPKPPMALILRPDDESKASIWLYLNPEDTGKEQGPFPLGDYKVNLIAPAFEPDPIEVSISIEEGTVPSVEFFMKPRGTLMGYVAVKEKGNGQAGESRQPDTEVQIQSITLKGSGLTRTLVPLKEEQRSYFEHYLTETDYIDEGTFYFYGLPAGEFELTIKANGYEQYSEIRNVRPGQYESAIPIDLIKKRVNNP